MANKHDEVSRAIDKLRRRWEGQRIDHLAFKQHMLQQLAAILDDEIAWVLLAISRDLER